MKKDLERNPVLQEYIPPELRNYDNPLQLLAKSIAFIDPLTNHQQFMESKFQLNWSKDKIIDQS